MKLKMKLLFFIFYTAFIAHGQTINIDSCGIDTIAIMNKFEINYIDSVFFAPFEMKKDEFGTFTNGFNFNEKRIAFFSCSKTTENGYMTKKEFFRIIIPEYRGPHGLTILSEIEKNETGYDAIIVISCKAISREEIVEKLKLDSKIRRIE